MENKGVKVTKSGRLLTKGGNFLTMEEADNIGMFDDIDMPWEKIKELLTVFVFNAKEIDVADDLEMADEEAGKKYIH